MRSRFLVHGLIATLLIGGIAVAADALVESDRERVQALAFDLTEGRAHERADAVLRWTDLSLASVRITESGRVAQYDERAEHALAQRIARLLSPFAAEDLEVVQRSVRVDGDRATVAVRVRAEGQLVDASFGLERSGQGWLVTELRRL